MGHPPKYILKYVNVRLNMPMDGSEPKSSSVRNGVTRFAEISPLWQHFESLWQFLIRGGGYWVFCQIVNQCWQMFWAIWQIFIVKMAKYWKKIVAIWSHRSAATVPLLTRVQFLLIRQDKDIGNWPLNICTESFITSCVCVTRCSNKKPKFFQQLPKELSQ